MQETIFKPKYPLRLYLGLAFIIPIEAFMLWDVFSSPDKSPEMIFGAGFFGLMVLLIPFVFVRRIKFESQSFTIEKYLLPAKVIDYSEIIDVGSTLIKTKQGNIATQSMTNSEELLALLKKIIDEGKINRYQIENKLVGQEIISRKALMPSGIIAGVLWVATMIMFPYEKSLFRDLSFLLFWVPTYILVYKFMKNRAENQ